MSKKILLKMEENKNIMIKLDDSEKKSILLQERKITGEEVFEILDYKIGDKYEVYIENEHNADMDVLNMVHKMFVSICTGINNLEIPEMPIPNDEVIQVEEIQFEVEEIQFETEM